MQTAYGDSQIAERLRQALALHITDMNAITIVVDEGIVTLSGEVASEAELRSAAAAASTVAGVQSVRNHLYVAGQDTHTVGEYIDDALITTLVKGKLLAEAGINSFSISVETIQGVVVLTGHVDEAEHVTLAERTAKMVNGVRRVDNKLAYKP